MKSIVRTLTVSVLMLCLLCLPLTAAAQADPINLMPQEEAGYTVVEGDGTVTLDGKTMTIVNNTDGDLRIWINYATPFDMTAHNAVHMAFQAEMPFKMAFHLISDADTTDDWLTTSTDYLDVFELNTETDRSPAGEYDVNMNIGDLAVAIKDKSSVHFDQYILLMTGKGTFTVNTVELVQTAAAPDEEVEPDQPAADTEEPAADADEPTDDTLTVGADDKADDAGKEAGFPLIPVIVGAVLVVAVAAVVVIIVKKRQG